jgi:hypothetical protein
MNNYFIWSKHGETQLRTESNIYEREEDGGEDDVGDNDEGLDVEELKRNVAPDVLLQCRNKSFDNFETLDKASGDLLHEECKGCHKEHIVLWMTLELLKLKASNGWSGTSFSALLELLSKVLPKPNGLPTNTYLAKKIICLLTLGVEKIHACLNHYMLYRKEHEFKEKYRRCNANQYKQNHDSQGSKERKVPTLVKWYLPIIDHLKHMFSNSRDAQLFLWHFQ